MCPSNVEIKVTLSSHNARWRFPQACVQRASSLTAIPYLGSLANRSASGTTRHVFDPVHANGNNLQDGSEQWTGREEHGRRNF